MRYERGCRASWSFAFPGESEGGTENRVWQVLDFVNGVADVPEASREFLRDGPKIVGNNLADIVSDDVK